MNKHRLEQYEFIWEVEQFSLPYVSIWMTPEVTRRRFILVGQGRRWQVYLHRDDRRALSIVGLRRMTEGFVRYRAKVRRELRLGSGTLRRLTVTTGVSDVALAQAFRRIVSYSRRLWSLYFWTEYFCYDQVEERLRQNGRKEVRQLQRRVREMQRLKYRLRRLLDQVAFGKGIVDPAIVEIARRRNIRNVNEWTYQELLVVLQSTRALRPRRKVYVTGKETDWKLYVGSRARVLLRQLPIPSKSLNKEIAGQTAQPGHFRGRVRIIPFDVKADYSKLVARMKRGEVLVTGSTGPDMMLACRKAGAIVTDEGGVTSHAAIVSRELGIPCVIGTKNATKVLQDGDLVEVDAVKGIVRKVRS